MISDSDMASILDRMLPIEKRSMNYLYVFSFCTPTQWINNDKHGWDDEDSYVLFINAASENDALEWGREISERFVTRLFERSDWDGTTPSWREGGFANWIETDPLNRFSGLALETLPVIPCSEVPNFDKWIQESGFGKSANAR